MKYIVEFEDKPCMYEDEVYFYKCIQAPWWGLSERVIKQLTPYQPDVTDTNVGNKISKFIDGIEEIFADIRERHGDDSVCGLCEYDGAYMGQSGDWCNECPGFDKDDCFKLSDETRKKWIEEIVNAYSDHTADIGKKVSISCGRENDQISRQMAIDTIMGQPPEPHYPSWYATQIEKLPAVQPDLSGYSDRLWKSAYERGKAEAQAERKQGHWLINSDGYYPYCSECKSEPKSGDMTDFCPSCGADMRGTEDG